MDKHPRQPEKANNTEREARRIRDFARYSGMAFQIGLVILAGTLIGKQLDAYVQWEKPIFTLILSLSSVFAALYLALKDFLKK